MLLWSSPQNILLMLKIILSPYIMLRIILSLFGVNYCNCIHFNRVKKTLLPKELWLLLTPYWLVSQPTVITTGRILGHYHIRLEFAIIRGIKSTKGHSYIIRLTLLRFTFCLLLVPYTCLACSALLTHCLAISNPLLLSNHSTPIAIPIAICLKAFFLFVFSMEFIVSDSQFTVLIRFLYLLFLPMNSFLWGMDCHIRSRRRTKREGRKNQSQTSPKSEFGWMLYSGKEI